MKGVENISLAHLPRMTGPDEYVLGPSAAARDRNALREPLLNNDRVSQ
jgi:hypothetical protein